MQEESDLPPGIAQSEAMASIGSRYRIRGRQYWRRDSADGSPGSVGFCFWVFRRVIVQKSGKMDTGPRPAQNILVPE